MGRNGAAKPPQKVHTRNNQDHALSKKHPSCFDCNAGRRGCSATNTGGVYPCKRCVDKGIKTCMPHQQDPRWRPGMGSTKVRNNPKAGQRYYKVISKHIQHNDGSKAPGKRGSRKAAAAVNGRRGAKKSSIEHGDEKIGPSAAPLPLQRSNTPSSDTPKLRRSARLAEATTEGACLTGNDEESEGEDSLSDAGVESSEVEVGAAEEGEAPGGAESSELEEGTADEDQAHGGSDGSTDSQDVVDHVELPAANYIDEDGIEYTASGMPVKFVFEFEPGFLDGEDE
ncbi:hypothetical protein CB0940_05968 [Cercospora beticola]|uniref:Zn(2)-C6 fungal-type domain-containing protein n=1 Tax=Cercospora beticola TaxID=122368 RepID=A0A2G5HY72_CERBT|nr:hypothetical protein CB0940_05968 [Cercospora beticola]PIA97233.1 hypothetical protein CB0940_05968 [Cercospora beticola]WPA98569.1 hypothetical protein RHO25_003181 [Cercospora beticola]CAK1359830.1 unnamed protein product [Cercospora beticola]